jgi:hypothetical protein
VTIDERLASYVRDQWPDLVEYAATQGGDAAGAPEIALSALTSVASRWRRVRGSDDLDAAVRAAVSRIGRQQREREGGADYQIMQVGTIDPAEAAPADVLRSGEPVIDPLPALARRVRRVRGRRLAGSAAGVAVVVVAVVLVVSSTGSDRHPRRRAQRPVVEAAPIAIPHALAAEPSSVAVGGGYLWTLELHPSSGRPGSTIVRRDLVSGRPEASYQVPGEDFGLAYGLGKVWAWGVNDTRRNESAVSSLDPTTGAVHAVRLDKGEVIAGAAFTAEAGWFTEPKQNRVLLVAPDSHGLTVRVGLPGARNVAPVSATSVVVSGTFGVMHELPANVLVQSGSPFLTYLSSTASYGVWIGHDNQLYYRTGIDDAPSVAVRLPLDVGLVTGDPATGVYVATRSNDPQHYDPYLVYYSPTALRAPRPRPTARLDGRVEVESMVSGQAGGIVFVTTSGAIESWNPSAVSQ